MVLVHCQECAIINSSPLIGCLLGDLVLFNEYENWI